MMFVGPGWMNKLGRWESPYELLKKSYEDGIAYYASLKENGELVDMTMSEFADYYRETHTYTQPECALWKDILYGSQKQHFWYCDPYMRATIDMNQGGAIIDLRPYVAKLDTEIGIGTKNVQDASYPFLIQANYRAGYFTHYAGEGTVKSCKLSYDGEEADLCLCRTKAHFSEEEGNVRVLSLDPVEVELSDVVFQIQSIYKFREASSEIEITRNILSSSKKDAKLKLTEYTTACYGTTEYPEDMTDITLGVEGDSETKTINYEYKCREEEMEKAEKVWALIPQIETKISILADNADKGFFNEGYAFSPMYTLGFEAVRKEKEALTTWLRLEKAN